MGSSDWGTDAGFLENRVADFEKHIVVSALDRCAGNRSKAARQLGTTPKVLACRIRRYGIDLSRFMKRSRRKGKT